MSKFGCMTRSARMVISGLPHHVTQRGNRREAIFFEDGDQEVSRDLLAEQAPRLVFCGLFRPTSSHIVSEPLDAARRGTAVRSPHCIPNGLYLSLFRLIQKVLRRSP